MGSLINFSKIPTLRAEQGRDPTLKFANNPHTRIYYYSTVYVCVMKYACCVMKKYQRDEIKEIILSTLLIVGVIAIAVTMPNAVQLFKYFKPRNAYERTRIRQSVSRIEKQGLIREKDGGFILTTKGERKAMQYKIESMRIARQKKWDGKWRMIMFDIPENKKMARRAINLALKRLGCVQYQKSVFVTPFPCKNEVDFIGDYFEVRRNIKLLLVGELEDDGVLRNNFGIKSP